MACRPNVCGSSRCGGQESGGHRPQSRRLRTSGRLVCLCSMERATVRDCTQKGTPTRRHTLFERCCSEVHRGWYIVVGSVRCGVIKQAVVRPRHHAQQTRSGCVQRKCWYKARVVGHWTYAQSALERTAVVPAEHMTTTYREELERVIRKPAGKREQINRKVPPRCRARTNTFGQSNEGSQTLEHPVIRVIVANQCPQGTGLGRSKVLALHGRA